MQTRSGLVHSHPIFIALSNLTAPSWILGFLFEDNSEHTTSIISTESSLTRSEVKYCPTWDLDELPRY